MPEFDITSPDGKKFRVTAPEGATQEEVLAYAQRQVAGRKQESVDPSEGGLPFRPFGVDTGLTMPQGLSRFAAAAGKAPADLWRGIKQRVGAESQEEIDAAQKIDAPLMKTGAGIAGNIFGNAGMLAPTAFIPGANTLTGAAIIGGGAGALQPTASGDSTAGNVALGAVGGAGGQAAGNALGRALRPVSSSLSPEEKALAEAAAREGIPLTAGQKTGSRSLQVAESVMENLPLTSGPQLAGKEAQQRAYTAAALRRAGMGGDSAAPEALAAQKSALGGTMERIAESNKLDFNQGLTDKLARIAGEAGLRGKSAAEPIESVIDRILAEVGKDGSMSGQAYQAWRQKLRPLSSGGGAESHYFSQIRRALDDAFNTQMEGAGSEAWKGANRQYANLKTIMQAAGGPGAQSATNQLSPAQLSAALRQAMGKEGVALGRGDLNELSRIGQVFVKDQIPNSGTAQRQFWQSMLTGGGGAGVGGIAALASGNDPMQGAAIGAAVGGTALAAPRIAQLLMNSKAGQKYLSEGAVALTDAERKSISTILRSAGIGALPALSAQ